MKIHAGLFENWYYEKTWIGSIDQFSDSTGLREGLKALYK